jgi:hypothetical protein
MATDDGFAAELGGAARMDLDGQLHASAQPL